MASQIIIHLHSLASGGNYLQNFFMRNAHEMEQHGLSYVGTRIEKTFQVENHQMSLNALIWALQHGKPYQPEDAAALESWRSAIRRGNNLLLSYRPKKILPSLKDALTILRACPDLRHCPIKLFVALGRHDYMYEDAYRWYMTLKPQQLYNNIVAYGPYEPLADELYQLCGKENVALFFSATPPVQFNVAAFSTQRTAFLEFCSLPLHLGDGFEPQAIHSEFSLRLLHLLVQMHNDYRPDNQRLLAELCNAEKELCIPPEWLSDVESRKQLYDTFCHDWENANCQGSTQVECACSEPESSPSPDTVMEQGKKIASRIAPELMEQVQRYLYLEHPRMSEEQRQQYTAISSSYSNIEASETVPLLTVLTMTRNQEQFIGTCLQAVIDQQCTFPIRHIVVDDFSTDNTRGVVSEFASKHPHIIPIFLDRKAHHGESIKALFQQCSSKYAALCDGDDYFTDPHKLQTQVDFLEAHADCALCFHPVRVVYEDGSKPERIHPPTDAIAPDATLFYSLGDLFKSNIIQTNSVVYRWRFANGLPEWFRPDCCPGDWYWHLLHAEQGKIGFINKVMSVYRRHKRGIYYLSEVDRLKHRATVGLKEIEVYDIINRHFGGKYQSILLTLVNGVFADCLMYDSNRAEKKDSAPILPTLVSKYPRFARHFLQSLKAVSAKK